MKKSLVILTLAIALVFAFAVSAMAQQNLANTPTSTDTAVGAVSSAYAASGTGDSAIPPATQFLSHPEAGQTTSGTVVGQDGDFRIHSNYTYNTNACQSCHALHTGVGAYLLQWADGQATCEACHDGTTKTYDVFEGKIANTGAKTFGGKFNVDSAANGGSFHHVEGVNGAAAVQIASAPGGIMSNDIAQLNDVNDQIKNQGNGKSSGTFTWGATFECLSCHDAHGTAGNARILNPNVNNYAEANAVRTTSDSLGLLVKDETTPDGTVWVAVDKFNQFVRMLTGYPMGLTVYDNAGTSKLTNYTLDNSQGYTRLVFTSVQATAPRAVYFPAVRVQMNVTNYLSTGETVSYVSGINQFCGACHTDYDTMNDATRVSNGNDDNRNPIYNDPLHLYTFKTSGSAYKNLNGTYHAAYRHSVGFTGHADAAALGVKLEQPVVYTASGTLDTANTHVFNCLSCHVAHGTDQSVWNDLATSGKVTSPNPEQFVGPDVKIGGSKLTRMPNFGICLSCHDKVADNEGMGY